jgi:hypothetical protein
VPRRTCPTATVRTPRRSKPRSNSAGEVKKGVREPKELALTTKPSGLRRAMTRSKNGGMLSITIRSNPSSSSKLAMSATRNRTAPIGRLGLRLRHHLCRDVYADDLGVRVAIGQLEGGGARPGADV